MTPPPARFCPPRVMPTDYAVNRSIDRQLLAFSWEDLGTLLKLAQVPRASRLLQVARHTVSHAQQVWPQLLEAAPASMRTVVINRLNRGVALTR